MVSGVFAEHDVRPRPALLFEGPGSVVVGGWPFACSDVPKNGPISPVYKLPFPAIRIVMDTPVAHRKMKDGSRYACVRSLIL